MQYFFRRHVCRLENPPAAAQYTFTRINPAIYERMQGPNEMRITGIHKDYATSPTAWASSRSRPCSCAAATGQPDPRTPPGTTAWCQAPSSSCSNTAATCPTSRNPSPTSRHCATSCTAPSRSPAPWDGDGRAGPAELDLSSTIRRPRARGRTWPAGHGPPPRYRRWHQGGEAALRAADQAGRRPRLSLTELETVDTALRKGPAAFGFDTKEFCGVG
jgi:hypothetical protein